MASALLPASDTLYPLPTSHHNGLIAVATFGFLSFITTTTLFAYLTVKLIKWHLTDAPPGQNRQHAVTTDLSLGLSQVHFGVKQTTTAPSTGNDAQNNTAVPKRQLNQFLLLVYNLLFAEMQQSMAFLLNVSWTASNGIFVGTSTCWAQGWFISTGDLAASCFITAIAIHTYLTVVRGYRPPQWILYVTIVGLWVFIYGLAIIGVLLTDNGRNAGGLYVRAVAWCWMNVKYENLRLWLHYFWIFVSLAVTSCLYILIFFSLQRQGASIRFSRDGRGGATGIISGAGSDLAAGTHPGFLIYPIIYGFCTAPLALFRVAMMSGTQVSVELFCFAGSMIASNGWLDVVLFSWTRSSIIFAPSPDSADTGLETFAFMRTPHTRRFGNMIWVQGGPEGNPDNNERRQNHGGWWRIGGDREHRRSRSNKNRWPGALTSVSQESLRRTGINEIQMDTVTSVVVEVDPSNKEPALSVDSEDQGLEVDGRKM